ncbi:unannotated protein [freshwater metagenome]|uniref:Unannotated protein n=1 Tax=freshwater metagenome TaxID=449393 RepID=A0A6J6JQI9_9ZZZZ
MPGSSGRAFGVTGEKRRDLDRHVTVYAVACVVDGTQETKNIVDVGNNKLPVSICY